MKFLYDTVIGRFFLKILLYSGTLKVLAKWLKSGSSKWLINYYINKSNIDMSQFPNVKYKSFAEFFSRKKEVKDIDVETENFISPCDSRLSVFDIDEESIFNVKGSFYKIEDLVPESGVKELFKDGLCLIFRLEASDYHHFCYIDDGYAHESKLIPGTLHSVVPVALEKYPVFRQNKRYYHRIDTDNYGVCMQIEVGAVLVGGVHYEISEGRVKKGQDAGYFELCGSTIILLMTKDFKEKFTLNKEVKDGISEYGEYQVKYGKSIGLFRK